MSKSRLRITANKPKEGSDLCIQLFITDQEIGFINKNVCFGIARDLHELYVKQCQAKGQPESVFPADENSFLIDDQCDVWNDEALSAHLHHDPKKGLVINFTANSIEALATMPKMIQMKAGLSRDYDQQIHMLEKFIKDPSVKELDTDMPPQQERIQFK